MYTLIYTQTLYETPESAKIKGDDESE